MVGFRFTLMGLYYLIIEVVLARFSNGECIKVAGHSMDHWDEGQLELLAFIFITDCIEPWMLHCEGILIEGDNLNVINFINNCIHDKAWKTQSRLAQSFALLLQLKNLLLFPELESGCQLMCL